jgi:hypothetical protein
LWFERLVAASVVCRKGPVAAAAASAAAAVAHVAAAAAAAAEATVAAAGASKTVQLPLHRGKVAAAAHFVAAAAPADGEAAGANTVLMLGDQACHIAAISWLWRGNAWCAVCPSPWSCSNTAKRANRTPAGIELPFLGDKYKASLMAAGSRKQMNDLEVPAVARFGSAVDTTYNTPHRHCHSHGGLHLVQSMDGSCRSTSLV